MRKAAPARVPTAPFMCAMGSAVITAVLRSPHCNLTPIVWTSAPVGITAVIIFGVIRTVVGRIIGRAVSGRVITSRASSETDRSENRQRRADENLEAEPHGSFVRQIPAHWVVDVVR